MNVFYEFHKIVQHLQSEGIEYALIGGVAMAFHGQPRFTKDIDLLVRTEDIARVTDLLAREEYRVASEPWTFRESGLTLHRFMKTAGESEMLVDILASSDERHARIISSAQRSISKGTGEVRVASKQDIIWLKSRRNSKQDQADIEKLQDEKS